ncbi:MAG: glutaminyl-peptide cyclotransferase [Bacteroidota bacterium]
MIKASYTVILFLMIFSCSESKDEKETNSSPRIRKSTSIENPTQNQSFTRGTPIPVSINTTDEFAIDSIEVSVGNEKMVFNSSSFEVNLPSQKVGTWRLLVKIYSKDKSETHYRKVVILPERAPEEMTYTIVNTFPHDTDDYTQGLLIQDGFLYESTGQRGKSTFKKKELLSGETLKVVNLSSNLFGEGLAWINEEFYQLTWESGQGFVYNKEMEQVRTFNYQVEGWGLTTLNEELILTDETEKLYFMDPTSFTVQRELEVYTNQGKVDSLNELEVIDGLIYANVYQEDYIMVIDPETGEVLRKIDCTGLLTNEEAAKADVLNGIAVNPKTNKIYVTGKLWPKLFEITIQPKTI